MWSCSRTRVALPLEPAHPAHIAARSRVGADGVGVESGAHLPPGPCAPMGASTIIAASLARQRPHRLAEKVSLSLFFLSDMGWSRG